MSIRKAVLLALGATSFATVGLAQQSITEFIGYYLQDFDTLATTGTSTTLPAGWADNPAATLYTADNGSATAAGYYSYGTGTGTDRALGSLSTLDTSIFGVYFKNDTGKTIEQFSIAYTGEMWRQGATGTTDKLIFSYSTGTGGSLTEGAWTAVTTLDFSTPNADGTADEARDGNLAANQTRLSAVITGLSIANGATFKLRWVDSDPTGANDGLGIDTFAIAVPEPATYGAAAFVAALALSGWYRRRQTAVAA